MSHADLLPTCPPSRVEQLQRQAEQLQSKIIRSNYKTQFAQTASELSEFRDATKGLSAIDDMDDARLSESFRKVAAFTTYDSYAPFIARLFEKPCKASAVTDLFVPGLPDYILSSSSTSGGLTKTFPKYGYFAALPSWRSGSSTTFDPLQKRTSAYIWHFWTKTIHLKDENDRLIKTVYLSSGSTALARLLFCLHPDNDEEKMGTFIHDHVAPYAAGFIHNWRSLLVINVLFALYSRALKTMSVVFIGTLVDMIRYLDTEFEVLVDSIANGTIPNLDGIAEVRHYLEMNVSPDPERAAELRSLGRPFSQPGWCSRAWPKLHSISAIAGGSFATSVPLARWLLGPNVEIHDVYYACTESLIGTPQNVLELNRYKLTNTEMIEFLDVDKSDSIDSLAQFWEVELGKRYEIVVTTNGGLWRYRIGDVIEILGFDPTDGFPIMQVSGRRKMAYRFQFCMVSEEGLKEAVMYMAEAIPIAVVAWTTTMDDRRSPNAIGFFVELANDQAANLTRAPEYVLEGLARLNQNITRAIGHNVAGKPTVRVVRSGTFSDFLQLKLDEGSKNAGQIKIPAVLPKPEYVAWFSDRVAQEL